MGETLPLDVLSRWLHVSTAIVVLGGSFFLRFVLIPATAAMPEAEHNAMRDRLMAIWRRVVHLGIVLFLLSGLYNYVVVAIPRHRGDGLYHALLGTKILLALVVFFLASALVGRSPALAGIRRDNRRWLVITLLLGFVIVGISGYLKVARPGGSPAQDSSVSETER